MIRLVLLSVLIVWWVFLPKPHLIKNYHFRALRVNHLQKVIDENIISTRKAIALLSHLWLFPFFLTVYLLGLLIDKTNGFGLARSRFFFMFDHTVFLVLTVVTWLLSIFTDETIENDFTHSVSSPLVWRFFLVLTLILAVISARIIHLQTLELERLSWLISAIVWWLLVLIGFLLFEEEEI